MTLPDIAREIITARLDALLNIPIENPNDELFTWSESTLKGADKPHIVFSYNTTTSPAANTILRGLGWTVGDQITESPFCVGTVFDHVQAHRDEIIEKTLADLARWAEWLLPPPRGKDRGVASAAVSRAELYQRWPWPWGKWDSARMLALYHGIKSADLAAYAYTMKRPELLQWRSDPTLINLANLNKRMEAKLGEAATHPFFSSWDHGVRILSDESFSMKHPTTARALGWLMHFEREVRDGQSISNRLFLPTDKVSRDLMTHWSDSAIPEKSEKWEQYLGKRVQSVSLITPGNVQLSLQFGDGFDLELAILNAIEQAVRIEGKNAWLALLHAATVQGKGGRFRFSMPDFLESIGAQNRQSQRAKYTGIIEIQSRVKLQVDFGYHTNPQTKKRKRLQWEEHLLVIEGAMYSGTGKSRELVGGVLNIAPRYWQNVQSKNGKPGSNFGQLSNAVLKLDRKQGRPGAVARDIAIESVFGNRHNLTPGGYWQTTGEYLLSATKLFPRYRENRFSAWQTIAKALDLLRTINPQQVKKWESLDLAGNPVPVEAWTKETWFHLWPADWYTDTVKHRVPMIGGGQNTLPSTGEELVSWRKKTGLSVTAAAKETGVSRPTWTKAEKEINAPISGKIRSGILERYRRLQGVEYDPDRSGKV